MLNYFTGSEISFFAAVKIGFIYLPGDAIKIAALTVTGPAIMRGVKSNISL
jgi:hypothetical protein